MTLRIVTLTAKGEAVLALHGWLTGASVAEFERVIGDVPLPLRIDLANLAGIDPSGVAALSAQRLRGARLANASPYISLLLKGHDDALAQRSSAGRPPRGGAAGR